MALTILAIDSATEYCSVALKTRSSVIARGSESPRKHADLILPYVDEVLKEAGITIADVDYIAVGRGPGSFTGIRIAAGIAQGLGFSHNIPLVGVSNLLTMAQQVHETHGAIQVATAIDARMGEVYWGTCALDNSQSDMKVMHLSQSEAVCSPTDAELDSGTWYTAGTGWETYNEQLTDRLSHCELVAGGVRLPHARYMLPLAEVLIKNGKAVDAAEFDVHYVRNEVTWKKLPGRA